MKTFLLGLAPTRRSCFSVEDAHKYKLDPRSFPKEARNEMTNVYKYKLLNVTGSAGKA